tara:strand:- start:6883 stop:7668 length:786 start_codon:yes stop_codon:yes gene_type:complete
MSFDLSAKRFGRLARAPGAKFRHLGVLVLAVLVVYLFLLARSEWSPMHQWNRAFGDASLIFVAFAMAIGPVARFLRSARPLLPWRRELGIWGVVLGLVHTAIILGGWVRWDLVRLFGFEFHPSLERYVMLQQGFGLANVIGIVALIYGMALALTSNNYSQRWLGGSVWKFLQQGTYVLWALIVIHTFYFMFMHFLDFHRQTPEPNLFRWPFVGIVVVIMILQSVAFLATWRAGRRGKGSRGGASSSSRDDNYKAGVEGAAT